MVLSMANITFAPLYIECAYDLCHVNGGAIGTSFAIHVMLQCIILRSDMSFAVM